MFEMDGHSVHSGAGVVRLSGGVNKVLQQKYSPIVLKHQAVSLCGLTETLMKTRTGLIPGLMT